MEGLDGIAIPVKEEPDESTFPWISDDACSGAINYVASEQVLQAGDMVECLLRMDEVPGKTQPISMEESAQLGDCGGKPAPNLHLEEPWNGTFPIKKEQDEESAGSFPKGWHRENTDDLTSFHGRLHEGHKTSVLVKKEPDESAFPSINDDASSGAIDYAASEQVLQAGHMVECLLHVVEDQGEVPAVSVSKVPHCRGSNDLSSSHEHFDAGQTTVCVKQEPEEILPTGTDETILPDDCAEMSAPLLRLERHGDNDVAIRKAPGEMLPISTGVSFCAEDGTTKLGGHWNNCVVKEEPVDPEWENSGSGETSTSSVSRGQLDHRLSNEVEKPRRYCRFCPYSSVSKTSMAIHERSHVADQSFTCNVCWKATTTEHSLSIRTGAETNEQSCQVLFTESSLNDRENSQVGETTYKCQTCDLIFSLKQDFDRHCAFHTSLKPFKCSSCKELFFMKSTLDIREILTLSAQERKLSGHQGIRTGKKPPRRTSPSTSCGSSLNGQEKMHKVEMTDKCEPQRRVLTRNQETSREQDIKCFNTCSSLSCPCSHLSCTCETSEQTDSCACSQVLKVPPILGHLNMDVPLLRRSFPSCSEHLRQRKAEEKRRRHARLEQETADARKKRLALQREQIAERKRRAAREEERLALQREQYAECELLAACEQTHSYAGLQVLKVPPIRLAQDTTEAREKKLAFQREQVGEHKLQAASKGVMAETQTADDREEGLALRREPNAECERRAACEQTHGCVGSHVLKVPPILRHFSTGSKMGLPSVKRSFPIIKRGPECKASCLDYREQLRRRRAEAKRRRIARETADAREKRLALQREQYAERKRRESREGVMAETADDREKRLAFRREQYAERKRREATQTADDREKRLALRREQYAERKRREAREGVMAETETADDREKRLALRREQYAERKAARSKKRCDGQNSDR